MNGAFSLYLDAIRLSAAMLVLLYHANAVYRPGYLITSLGHEAVVIFFVLSGFVIAYVAGTRQQSFRDFMVARGARIFSVAIPAIVLTGLLDFAGYHLSESAYPENYQAWDYPLIRIVSSALFLNEIWTLGIQLFTNAPYWSLNYEVWYYVLFGVLFFFEGKKKWIAFGVLCLALGPKILLLLPVWWMGVYVYRSPTLTNLSMFNAWLCFLASIAGAVAYIKLGASHWGWDYMNTLLGDELHRELSFSRQFVGDYFLGIVLALHFAGTRVLLSKVTHIPQTLERGIRYFAGATFSIYLFHQPILFFYTAVFSGIEEGLPSYAIIVPLTIATVLLLATVTEHKKQLWQRWVDSAVALGERGYARLLHSRAG
ncbi:MAG: acyltransferase family protein [Halioglobus sp.]